MEGALGGICETKFNFEERKEERIMEISESDVKNIFNVTQCKLKSKIVFLLQIIAYQMNVDNSSHCGLADIGTIKFRKRRNKTVVELELNKEIEKLITGECVSIETYKKLFG